MVVEKVSEPVSSWMPRANTVASNGVIAMPRCAKMPTSSVTSDPSAELTRLSGWMKARQVAGQDVVVEGEDLHVVARTQVGEVADAVGVDGIDKDQALDAAAVDVAGIDDRDQIGVERLEVAHVAVDRSAQRDRRLRVELARGHHRRESVEVGVAVGRDEFGRCACQQYTGPPQSAAAVRP